MPGQAGADCAQRNRRGVLNLKFRGTLLLVEGARLARAKAGIPATSTLARVDGPKQRKR